MSKILIITTSADTLKNGVKTGLWLEELAAPYRLFKDAGYQVDIASVKGGRTPLDEASLAPDTLAGVAKEFHESSDDMAVLNAAIKLDTVKDLGQYKAVYIPGGHGAVVDLPDNSDVQRILVRTRFPAFLSPQYDAACKQFRCGISTEPALSCTIGLWHSSCCVRQTVCMTLLVF